MKFASILLESFLSLLLDNFVVLFFDLIHEVVLLVFIVLHTKLFLRGYLILLILQQDLLYAAGLFLINSLLVLFTLGRFQDPGHAVESIVDLVELCGIIIRNDD